jgi:hypothetical protein
VLIVTIHQEKHLRTIKGGDMNGRQLRLLIISAIIPLLLLVACGEGPVPVIDGITVKPPVAQKGGTATYTVEYHNNSEEASYEDVEIVLFYDEYLTFNGSALPFPAAIDEGQREMTWQLGTLRPGDRGDVSVEFRLARNIPTSVYELIVTAQIYSANADGDRTRHDSGRARGLIEGHPTPTPLPTNTPSPTKPPTRAS